MVSYQGKALEQMDELFGVTNHAKSFRDVEDDAGRGDHEKDVVTAQIEFAEDGRGQK
jgi:hypothetical protein